MAITYPSPSEHNYIILLLHREALRSWNTAVWERKQYSEDGAALPAIKVDVHWVFPVVLMKNSSFLRNV